MWRGGLLVVGAVSFSLVVMFDSKVEVKGGKKSADGGEESIIAGVRLLGNVCLYDKS